VPLVVVVVVEAGVCDVLGVSVVCLLVVWLVGSAVVDDAVVAVDAVDAVVVDSVVVLVVVVDSVVVDFVAVLVVVVDSVVVVVLVVRMLNLSPSSADSHDELPS